MSNFKKYLEASQNSAAIEASLYSRTNAIKKFKNRKEFDIWLKKYRSDGGKLSDKIKIEIPNFHGNLVIYDSPLDVINEG